MKVKKVRILILILFLALAILTIYVIIPKGRISEVVLDVDYFNDVSDTVREHVLHNIFGIRVDSMGYVYVLDRGNNRVVKFSPDGKFLTWFGGTGQGPGELLNPIDFDIDRFGNIVVLEKGNQRVSIFNKDGKWINSFSLSGDALDIFVTPQGEIFINMPVSGVSLSHLFHVYNFKGEKIGEIGDVELMEKKPFDTYLVTQILNYVTAMYNGRGDEIWAIYKARPLFRRFSVKGKILVEKIINTPETKAAIKANEEYQKRHLSKGWFGWLYVFTNIDFMGDDTVVVGVINFADTSNCLYLLNRKGEVITKYVIPKLKIFNFFAINRKENKIIIASLDTLYQAEIKEIKRED